MSEARGGATPTELRAMVEGAQRLPIVPWWRSFVLRFVGLYTVISIALALTAINWFRDQYAEEIARTSGETLEAIATTAALALDGEIVAQIRTESDVTTPQFQAIRGRLEAIRAANDLREDQVYLIRPHSTEPDVYLFVAMLQAETFVGDVYRPPAEVAHRYTEVLRTGKPGHTPLFTDDNGTFIGGMAPVYDAQGHPVALLEVDHSLGDYMMAIERAAGRLRLGLLGLVTALLLTGVWLYWDMRRGIIALLEGTQAIAEEDYDHRIALMGRDELGVVAFALNRVAGKLKERFEMLKFLPRHTFEMISLASGRGHQVDLSVSQRLEVTILESDIRGFTRLSEHLPPEEVIGLLNRYIRAQAELITEHGGSIDKYMGDAVLAIFDGPDRIPRALTCAAHIITALRALAEGETGDVVVKVGVGLSDGTVVMGNMGSELRMEHTVIGATVNLAARLCSAAEAEEIVCQAFMLDAIGGAPPGFVTTPTLINAKGFSQPVPCARLSLR